MWLILGPLVLAAFLYAILNRPDMPIMDGLPGGATGATSAPDPD